MQRADNYPTGKVILCYALLGTLVGAIILNLLIAFDGLFSFEYPSKDFSEFFSIFNQLKIFLLIFGCTLIPASLTGCFLAIKKFALETKFDYFRLMTIGFLFSFLPALVLMILSNFSSNLFHGEFFFYAIISGSLSTIIVGSFVLPKEKNHAKK